MHGISKKILALIISTIPELTSDIGIMSIPVIAGIQNRLLSKFIGECSNYSSIIK